MAVTETKTVREICEQALEDLGAKSVNRNASAEEMRVATDRLSRMLKSPTWNTHGIHLHTSQSVTLTTAQSYALTSPARPFKVISARYKGTDGNEIPMVRFSRQEWDELVDKTTLGTPSIYYLDEQNAQTTLYIWPQLASATTESVEMTITRETEDLDLDDVLDAPGELYDAICLTLAAKVALPLQLPVSPELAALQNDAFMSAMGDLAEGEVQFFAG